MAHVDCLSRYPIRQLRYAIARSSPEDIGKEDQLIQHTVG
ncbi:unnamed protein product, partial [Allacma fusca]